MNIGKHSAAGGGFPRPLSGRGLFALLLAACLIAGALPCTRAEADGVRRVTVRYHVWEDSPEKSYEVDFDDSVFFSDPGVYSHALCRMSLGMALSAFRPTDKDGDQSGNIRSFLREAGFEAPRVDQYDKETGEDTIGTAIALKRLTENGRSLTLAAVAVCGGNYRDEWLGNFKVGTPGEEEKILYHQGFFEAASKVRDRVEETLSGVVGEVRVWFTGYSRGAAVANLAAALLLKDGAVSGGDAFVYTFATPANTVDSEAGAEEYKGFYSITGMFDIVPKVPLAAWGFTRYGKTLTLPSLESDGDYSVFFDRASAWSARTLNSSFFRSTLINYFLEKIVDAMGILFEEPRDYVEKMQSRAMAIWREKGNMLEVLRLLGDVYNEISDSERFVLDNLLAEEAWQGLVQWSGTGQTDVSFSHSLTQNLAREHDPDVYVSLVMSSGKELFDEDRGYVRIVVSGKTELTVVNATDLTDSFEGELTMMTVTAAGAADGADAGQQPWPLMVFSGGSVLTLPAEELYLLEMKTSEEEVDDVVFREYYGGGARSVEKNVAVEPGKNGSENWAALLDLTPGADRMEDIIFFNGSNAIYSVTTSTVFTAGLIDMLFITGETASRNLRTVACVLGGLTFLLLLTLVLSAVWASRGRVRRAAAVMMALLFVLYALVLLSIVFLPAWGGFRAVFKGTAAVTLLMLCLLMVLRNKCRRNTLMLLGFILYILNDVLIDFRLEWGMAASMIGNVLFGAAFLLGAKKTLARRIAGACVLLPGVVLLAVFRSHPAVKGNIAEMAVYTAALAFMVASSFGQGRLIRAGAVLLAATGVTVFCGLAAGASWMTHAAGLALYYSGMVCLSLGTLDGMKVPVLSDRAQRKKQLKKERDADKLG